MNPGTSNERENVQHASSASSKKRSATPEEEPPRKRYDVCYHTVRANSHLGDTPEQIPLIEVYDSEGEANKDDDGKTALHFAAKFGFEDLLRKLLTSRPKGSYETLSYPVNLVDIQDKYGTTALHEATEEGSTEIVKMLLAAGSNTRLQNNRGQTSLHIAAYWEREDIAELICNADGGNILQDKNEQTALHLALGRGYENIAELICNAGGGNSLRDKGRSTVLHLAAERGYEGIVRTLLTSKSRESYEPLFSKNGIDILNLHEMTALHMAIKNGSTEIVKMLLAAGSNPLLLNNKGQTSLHIAARRNSVKITELICNADGGNILQDEDGKTALHLAAERGYEGIVRKLLFTGMHPYLLDKEGNTPLLLALKSSNINNVFEVMIPFIILRDIAIEWKDLNSSKVNIENFKKRAGECIAEIQCMKETKVFRSNVSYYDLATKQVRQVADYLENQDVSNVLLNGCAIKDFPNYSHFIDFKVKKAETRRVMKNRCLECFALLFKNLPYLPKTIVNDIFTYLSDQDMQNFFSAFQCSV